MSADDALVRAYREAVVRVGAAEREARAAMGRAFPVGSTVQWYHGVQPRHAIVLGHGYGRRLRVRGVTGAEYWIPAYEELTCVARPSGSD